VANIASRHTSHGKRVHSNSKLSQGHGGGSNAGLRSKWARAIATEVNSKNTSPSGSFRNSDKHLINNVANFKQ
jgi:hypothetical protein